MCDLTSVPLVSVVIPTYGRASLLEKAIKSVLNQSYKNIEIIIVNDNGLKSDHYQDTMNNLLKYKNIEKIRIIADGINCGGSLARNKGIEASRGKYITFLDDDDYYYYSKIQSQLDHILNNEIDVSVCGMDIEFKSRIIHSEKGKAIIGNIKNFILRGRAFTPMIFAKKEVLESVGGFTHTNQFQDHILMIKILEKGFNVRELDQALFVHYNHEGNRITGTKIKLENYKIRREYEQRNLYKFNEIEKKKYFLINHLINSRYYRGNRQISNFLKEIKLSLGYLTNFKDFLNIIKVLVSYFVK